MKTHGVMMDFKHSFEHLIYNYTLNIVFWNVCSVCRYYTSSLVKYTRLPRQKAPKRLQGLNFRKYPRIFVKMLIFTDNSLPDCCKLCNLQPNQAGSENPLLQLLAELELNTNPFDKAIIDALRAVRDEL